MALVREPGAAVSLDSSAPLEAQDSEAPFAHTVNEVAELLRLDPRTIREMVRSGELEGNQRGHAIRISRTSVLDWLRGKRPSRARRGSR